MAKNQPKFNPRCAVACQTRFKSSTAVPQPSLGLLRPPTYHLKALDELYKSLAERKSRIRRGSPCGGPQVAVRSVELAGGCPTRSRRRCRRSSWCRRRGARCGVRAPVRPRGCGGREGGAARTTSSWTCRRRLTSSLHESPANVDPTSCSRRTDYTTDPPYLWCVPPAILTMHRHPDPHHLHPPRSG